jgi:hypothetical protein
MTFHSRPSAAHRPCSDEIRDAPSYVPRHEGRECGAPRECVRPSLSGAREAASSQPVEVVITRWRSEEVAKTIGPVSNDQVALLMIALAPVEVTSRVNGVVVYDGRMSAGMFQLMAPGDSLQASFRSAVDFVRIHVPR